MNICTTGWCRQTSTVQFARARTLRWRISSSDTGWPPIRRVSTGQYTRPAGLFYGGVRRTWSAMTLQRLVAEHLPPAVRTLAVLDIHTGLGPAAYGEPIAIGAASSVETARAWYGPEVTSLDAGDSISAKVVGVVPDGIAESPSRRRVGVCRTRVRDAVHRQSSGRVAGRSLAACDVRRERNAGGGNPAANARGILWRHPGLEGGSLRPDGRLLHARGAGAVVIIGATEASL